MAELSFSWRRFWSPRDGAFALVDGFLLDPTSTYGAAANPDVVPFEAIEEAPCLVLLGEPGLGKTTALDRHRSAIEQRLTGAGARLLWKNLNAYGTDGQLVRSVFEDPAFTAWAAGDGVLHLFLDSLDECLLRVDTLACLLSEELAKYAVERLRLMVACRTAVSPAPLQSRLRELSAR